jgi:hypothetical protein
MQTDGLNGVSEKSARYFLGEAETIEECLDGSRGHDEADARQIVRTR